MPYLNTYAFGPDDRGAETVEDMYGPTILLEDSFDSYEKAMNRVAEICRDQLEREALRKGNVEQGDRYRVSFWIPGATKRDAFAGYVSAYWFSDGTIGDTTTGVKHRPRRVKFVAVPK